MKSAQIQSVGTSKKRASPSPIPLLAAALTALAHHHFTPNQRHTIGLHFSPLVATAQTGH